ncbi:MULTISPECIES: iron chaperone [Dehalococcoides]|jgi:uncharacterized protein YdhG (YjbR/CyaY superfamily)|uniref:YdhG-like domain-containing protein n=2 Tax=Dehalococcoides mccartyi TaxID=61435 RepID=A0A142VAR7_9CHLR|nr:MULTISPECIES: DUF1801 domain-containing protein [Dehalococcoides]AGG06696.1 hypothetical protein dcmb_1096 [Dehalococcoides mccartyi DCMB5]AGG08191.1 hypothetical protein btf_1115 [Dehalococcoides mccartyi BTF08]AII61196.1 hypothetical protein X794_05155 [Dehalococcoides mccartyi CG5]AMU86888.1 hypothetical protein Dm11a5_1062 [Dehalococcoides mccartyi]AOV99679.1 hypothetical protein DCWBC2_1054 [Dehalococcoides mccartyi]
MLNTPDLSIDKYIKGFPENVRNILQDLRQAIHEQAPKATETISYGIPTFKQNGNLVHFGAYKNHIGFYPTPSGIKAFEKELSAYEISKGTVRFPLNEPIPYSLVKKIVAFRVNETSAKRK